jgi:hypothetical protein
MRTLNVIPLNTEIQNKNYLKLSIKMVLCIVFVVSSTNIFAQISADSLDNKILHHFEEFLPELYLYDDFAMYGVTLPDFDEDQITKEQELYREVINSELIDKPTKPVFALCHNLLIHSPDKGEEFLKLLNRPTDDEETISNLSLEFIFSGEFGEKLALDNVESDNVQWREKWSDYLRKFAIYESSIPKIMDILQKTDNTKIKQNLISALTFISNPKSVEYLKQIIETTQLDEVQASAIYAYTELAGYHGIKYIEAIMPLGVNADKEIKSSLDWLKTDTSPNNIFGTEVLNDLGFIERFGDIRSPAIIWLENEGLLNVKKAQNPKTFTKSQKAEFLNKLIESKGFGLEAAKAQLFKSIEPSDIDVLLKLRQYCWYSPNDFSNDRMRTLGIYIRYLRKTRDL